LRYSLQQNDIHNISELDNYIRHDIQRTGVQLAELKRKLQIAYKIALERPIEGDHILDGDDVSDGELIRLITFLI